ncbi:MAG: hypothetical protein UU48_C0039G0005 [Candidatus Uhrbacteria bacterium GW2011_GWF2_41_16]|uniref:Neutral/alkaline non-lysosomal ceramidase N-terminal domain-containing protein n=1 Tax=Candidatus Uhrbacteria bacterium GW2011_GWF2_41_16 TaxID=1618997 RepID=A0A0G0Y6M0_9BACT|nr:MAG: hypothetical protein UU48_C0039G0005 [Candidatus Uhrbacteria bacterium GW2011_GWF2_41_16]
MYKQNLVADILHAGIARSDITTDAKDVLVKDPLYAKALVLDDGSTKIAIIAMDVTAIGGRQISQGMLPDVGEDFLPKLRSRIQKELKIPGCNILVNASHTHPPGRLLCDDEEQIKRTFDAVKQAMQNMTEVKVGSGLGHENRITMNRTLRLKNGKSWTIRHSNPCPPDEEVADVGLIDPEIGIIRIDRMDGSLLAVVYNFACHPLFGDAKGSITANFPGVASKVIEENLGNGAMALFLQGAGGDIVDVLFKDFNLPRDIEPLGTMLGLSTLKALRNIQTKDIKLNVISETIQLPRRTDISERIKLLQAEQTELLASLRFTSLDFKTFLPLYIKYTISSDYPSDYSYRYLQNEKINTDEFTAMDSIIRKNIEKYLKNINAMEKLTRIQDDIATLEKHQAINQESGEETISAEVQGIKIGDCVLITSPAEVLVEVGLNVKKTSPYEHTFWLYALRPSCS